MAINLVQITADVEAAFVAGGASPTSPLLLAMSAGIAQAIANALTNAVVSPTTKGVPSMVAGPNPVTGTGELK